MGRSFPNTRVGKAAGIKAPWHHAGKKSHTPARAHKSGRGPVIAEAQARLITTNAAILITCPRTLRDGVIVAFWSGAGIGMFQSMFRRRAAGQANSAQPPPAHRPHLAENTTEGDWAECGRNTHLHRRRGGGRVEIY